MPFGNAAVSITKAHNIGGHESYVVARFNFSNGKSQALGEYVAYTLQFLEKNSDKFRLRRIAALGPFSILANGMMSSDGYPGAVFITNIFTGLTGRLKVLSDRLQQGLWSFEELKAPLGFRTAVNGLRIYQSHIYWTKSDLFAAYKIPITKSG